MDEFKCNNLIYVFVVLAIVLTSCFEPQRSAFKMDNGIEFETINREEQYILDNKTDYPSCNVELSLSFPVSSTFFDIDPVKNIFVYTALGMEYENVSINTAIDRYFKVYVDNYKEDARIYRTSKPKIDDTPYEFEDIYLHDGEHANLPEVFYSYYEKIVNKVAYDGYGLLSFQVIKENNKGGGLSHEQVSNYTIDLERGELITEADVFLAGYDEALRPIIQYLLMELHGVRNIEQIEDLGFFGIEEILPNRNFMITADGFVYTFNKGEYSAYQLPPAEITIPFSAVRSLMRDHASVKMLGGI